MLQSYMNLPGPAKAGLAIAGGAGVMASLFWVVPREYFWLLILAIALSGLVLLLYRAFLKWRDKGRAKPFERQLAENSGATPQGVTDATRRARLDDLRRKFEEGVSTFKEHGKDLYSMPWYLLVGEPGSGKTEAIRHCKVSFPPGLQDQLQGAGGTLNMNWWFTNHAVVLDTAGRLMFEEVEAGKSSEWKEFLKLMRTARPNCPINGLLLVIPADSLIADSSDDIMHKAGRIAEQLDGIQRALGVRFPAFVVITKCDLINGFREFFADLDDPTLQQQILGWSNPADLDAPFRPEQVEEHLREVADRLRERRMSLLTDPVHTEDELGGRRIDQVDALYSFPDSILKISSRLKLYMETVFVAGEWSTKPLFLRGIYFTSSMQKGAELDAELAEALGVDVKSLPEGAGFSRNTSLFLRDLFMNKVFREKGLVTAATNARKQQRNRRYAVAGAGVIATLLLIGITWFSGRSYSGAMGEPSRFWGDVASFTDNNSPEDQALLYEELGEYKYQGATSVQAAGRTEKLVALPVRTMEQARADRSTPAVFRPVAAVSGGNPFDRQREAHEAVLRRVALEPLVGAARDKLSREQSWGRDASAALAQLLRLDGGARDEDGRVFEIVPVARYVLSEKDADGREVGFVPETAAEIERLQEVIDWTYAPGGGAMAWPPASLTDPDHTVTSAVRSFGSHWAGAGASGGGKLGLLGELREAMGRYSERERELLARVQFPEAGTTERFGAEREAWSEEFGQVKAAHDALAAVVARVESTFGSGAPQDLAGALDEARDETLGLAREQFAGLEAEVARARAIDEQNERFAALETELRSSLAKLEEEVRASTRGLGSELRDLGAELLRTRRGAGAEERPFAARFAMLGRADEELSRASESASFEDLASVLDRVRREGEEAAARIVRLRGPADEASEATQRVVRVATTAVDASQRRRAAEAIGAAMDSIVGAEGGVRALVEARSRSLDPVLKPRLPLSAMDGDEFNPAFHPGAAASLFGAADRIRRTLDPEQGAGGSRLAPLDAERLGERAEVMLSRMRSYADDYLRYWSAEVIGEMEPSRRPGDWDEMFTVLAGSMQPARVNPQLVIGAKEIRAALEAARPFWGQRESGVYQEMGRLLELLDSSDRTYIRTLTDRMLSWQELTGSMNLARREILALTPPRFRAIYLEGVYDEQEPPVRYWSDAVHTTLSVLAEASRAEAAADARRIATDHRRFPVCRGAPGEDLDPEGVFRVHDDLVSLLAAAAEAGEGRTIGDGQGFVDLRRVNALLEDLRGDRVMRAEQRRFFVERVLPAVRWLRGDAERPQLPEWELVLLSPEISPEQREASSAFGLVRIEGGQGPGDRLRSTRRGADANLRCSVYDQSPMRVTLWKFEDPNAPGNARVDFQFPRGWTALRLVLDGRASRVEGTDGVWAVPVSIDDNGRTLEYKIGFRFRRTGMPGPASWPDADRWPVNLGG